MKKKILLAIAMVTLLVCALAITASAVEVDGVYYDLDAKNQVATVNTENRTATTEIVTIPSTFVYEGTEYRVTKISNDAFYGNKSVKELRILSEYITAIPTAMIADTKNGALEKIYIDFSRITSIGSAAFNPSNQTNGNSPVANSFYYYEAKAFIENGTDVKITDPDFSNCTSIGAAAFQGANFEKLTIPAAVYLNNQIFRQSTIKELVIEGEDREKIEYYVFNYCKYLEKITIKSKNLKSISNDVFSSCSAVKEIYIDLSKCTSIGSGTFIFNGSYDGGQTRTQWYNLEGEKIVDLSSVKAFYDRCFASSNLGSATIVWPTGIETLQDQTFRKCNITQPMLINAAEGKTLSLPYWCFNGNSPSILICNEGVAAVNAAFSGVTAVFLAPSINITSDGSFKNGSTLYCYSFAEGSKQPDPNHCTTVDITDGVINNYGVCGVVASLTTAGGNVTVGEASHTTSDAIDNSLCPIGQVTVTSCKYCDYEDYSIGGVATERVEHNYSLTGSISYVNFYEMGYKTNKCECGAEKSNEVATEAAIFVFIGVSFSEYKDANGTYSAVQGYGINQEAYNAYIESGKSLEYGFVASIATITGTQPLKVENGKACAVNGEKTILVEQGKIAHDYFQIKLLGLKAEHNGIEAIMCLYVCDGESIYYLNKVTEEKQSTSADVITVNIAE